MVERFKQDLISRADAIGVLMETIAPPSVTLDTLVMRIDSLPSASVEVGEWIPCSERLPRENEEVLMSASYTGWLSQKQPYVECGYRTGNGWHSIFGDNYITLLAEVTAWMPLPEPYKGGEDE